VIPISSISWTYPQAARLRGVPGHHVAGMSLSVMLSCVSKSGLSGKDEATCLSWELISLAPRPDHRTPRTLRVTHHMMLISPSIFVSESPCPRNNRSLFVRDIIFAEFRKGLVEQGRTRHGKPKKEIPSCLDLYTTAYQYSLGRLGVNQAEGEVSRSLVVCLAYYLEMVCATRQFRE
jgi:hypothetical protein